MIITVPIEEVAGNHIVANDISMSLVPLNINDECDDNDMVK